MVDLSSLGTPEEIAAAAMAAAGLGDLFGTGPSHEETSSAVMLDGSATKSTEADVGHDGSLASKHGLKRGHDEVDNAKDLAQEADPVQRPGKRANVMDYDLPDAHDINSTGPPPHTTVKDETPLGESKIGYVDNLKSKTPTMADIPPKIAAESRPVAIKDEGKVGGRQQMSEVPDTAKVPEQMASSAQTTSASAALALLSGIQNLEAVAQAAMGLDAQGNPLPGNEESHRALAEAVKRLSNSQAYASNAFTRTAGAYQLGSSNADADDSPIKRFQCHLCERAFARAYNLNTHLATHDPDPAKSKPFPCPYPSCKADGGRSFSRKHDLQRHVASTHENEPVPEDDEDVDENGTRVSILAKLGLGTPGRKFRCEDCGRAFVRRDALKRHQCVPTALTPPSSNGSPQATASGKIVASPYATGHATLSSANQIPSATVSSMPLGLSLYTSTAPDRPTAVQGQSQQSAQRAPNPVLPASLSYESLSREVQDMAMHLVAQATSYNEAHGDVQIDESDRIK